jgi:hypothetical protein
LPEAKDNSKRQMLAMELGKTSNFYLMAMYVYLKAYDEAISDFEGAVKDAGYADIALMSVKQKYKDKIDRLAREIST